jgi:hypothetical protein
MGTVRIYIQNGSGDCPTLLVGAGHRPCFNRARQTGTLYVQGYVPGPLISGSYVAYLPRSNGLVETGNDP